MEEEQIYEELANEQFMNHGGNKKVVILLLLILIVAIGLLIWMWSKYEPEKEKEETNEPVVTEKEGYQTQFECDDKCTYDLDLTSGKVTVTYEKIQNEDYTYLDKVIIGDTVVSSKNHLCGGPATLGVLDDVILISYHDGCDIGGNTLHAYTKEGVEIFKYEYLDTTLNMWLESTSYSIKGKKIIVESTRLYHGNTLRLDSKREVNLCEKTEWPIYEINEDTLVSGTYEIEYEGSGKFREPILTNQETVESVISSCKES